ncbi:hypothetical protein B0J13DRAFT_203211 [Dactylonectria estremocensis]|uniref:PSP1 C-terminal domain-containing protein n=1 Tax=Dactylonectria estremocensis TaxID=1079267 RepID=A0A9P9DB95_9HYPO|nr:hypothetical protein B0J13DRAFT_203211 [Dactylonectria estremocensis]
MSSALIKTGPPSRLDQGTYPPATVNNQSPLLDKLHARTSTPDSEALVSSGDEGNYRQDPAQQAAQPLKHDRRPSWLSETPHSPGRPRKGPFASSSMLPTASHPSPPSTETGADTWGPNSTSSVMGRAPTGSTFLWGTGIWDTERKDPKSRLREVLPSPISTMLPGAGGNSFSGGAVQTAPVSRDPASNSQISFAIPLHPTPKTYSSQSYSIGQQGPETNSAAPSTGSSAILGLARHPGHPPLQHRPSQLNMLSEMTNDGSMIGKVKKVEDCEDESANESLQGSFHQTSEAKNIEMLARENATSKDHLNACPGDCDTGASYIVNDYALRESVLEESNFAFGELDEANESGEALAKRALGGRMSEFGPGPLRSPFGMQTRKNDNAELKKALWPSSLNYPMTNISQSRRHSFANMPTSQGSISFIPDSASVLESVATEAQQPPESLPGYPDPVSFGVGSNAASYFGGGANLDGEFQPGFDNQYSPPYDLPTPYRNRAPFPDRNVYSIAQPRHHQLLHIVLFKCARADVFYIQEGTGLTVKPGDLVIVEADRGIDLGTVAKDNVDWQSAKDLKEHYAEEQCKWLMMYSQGAEAAQESAGAGLLISSTGLQGRAVGGMGPHNQHHMQAPNAGELRPKLIIRLAQSHEVHSLWDKEDQEAKAKRICMQKVKEHGLNMEILDAEFQMDRKKLAFYFFADNYINFNSLVKDLFKIYRTRIWMSAINPASFPSRTLVIQAPSGIGSGAVAVARASGGKDRRQNQQPQEHHQPVPAFPTGSRDGSEFRPNFNQLFGGGCGPSQPSGYTPSNYIYRQFGAFGNPRSSAPYVPRGSPNVDGFAGRALQQPGDLQSMRHRFSNPQSRPSPMPYSQGASPISPQNHWLGSFQGLSLKTH